MGDGGVACAHLQPIMDQFPGSESSSLSFRGGKDSKFDSELVNFDEREMKSSTKTSGMGCLVHSGSSKEVGNGEIEDEVEEGELRLSEGEEFESGEFAAEKRREFEGRIENGESVIVDYSRKRDAEKGEFLLGKGDNGKFCLDDYENGELEQTESRSWREQKDELENGEFVPEEWHDNEMMKEEDYYSRAHGYASRDKVWKCDSERTPPLAKYRGEKDCGRRSNQFIKSSSRLEAKQDKKRRISSKIEDEEGFFKNEHHMSKSHGRNNLSGNRLKRHGTDSDSIDHRHFSDYDDNTVSKSRRLSDNGTRSAYLEHYPQTSVDRPYRYSLSSRNMPSDRYSFRQYESSLSSKVIYDRHNNSPHQDERSPREQARYHDHRERSPTPAQHERSEYDRSRYQENRKSPSYSDWSPRRGRYQENRESPSYSDWSPHRRDRTAIIREHSPVNRARSSKCRKPNKKNGSHGKKQCQRGKKLQETVNNLKKSDGRDSEFPAKEAENKRNLDSGYKSHEKMANLQYHRQEISSSPFLSKNDSLQVNGTTEEFLSMEEDMDICNTPPHVPLVADSNPGKWFYLDQHGTDRGPSRLCDLKMLVEDGILVSDHLIKHLDSDMWVTVENAVSPLVTLNFPSNISDTVTQLVTLPEPPDNELDGVDVMRFGSQIGDEKVAASSEPMIGNISASEATPDFHLDERVGALLEGCTIMPGRELEAVGEVLQMTFDKTEREILGNCEEEHFDQNGERSTSRHLDVFLKRRETSLSSAPCVDSDSLSSCGDWFSGRWSCKGGDWKRNDEAFQDKSCRKKYVLNGGYPLCLMPRSGHEDPRRHQKDEFCNPSSGRLDLPFWAFSSPDELDYSTSIIRLSQSKSIAVRGVRGTMLPVIRINTCVVKDHGSFVSEPCAKANVKDWYSLRASRHCSSTTDAKRPSEEGGLSIKNMHDQNSEGGMKSLTLINVPKDRLCTADDLQLHVGDWYYLNGTGHEQGPLLSSEIQVLAEQGIIQKHASVFRKVDNIWVPVISVEQASQAAGKIQRETSCMSRDNSAAHHSESKCDALTETFPFNSFDSLHPHYIGYTRGKLHELVMKSYKSREFAAAINEVLDPWINVQQPRKEMEKYTNNVPVNNRFQRSDQYRDIKRPRLLVDGSEENYELEADITAVQNECLFEDLCKDVTFSKEDITGSEIGTACWGLLDGLVLARVFHSLRADLKSLVRAALTCKHWRSVSKVYKDICIQADLSSVAPNCTDTMIRSILEGYNKKKITSLVLRGCTNITAGTLEGVLQLLPSISYVDIRGCIQFEDLISRFPSIIWVSGRVLHSRMRTLEDINERSSVFKISDGIGSQYEDSSGLRHYLENLSVRDRANQFFRGSLYKRSKLFDARRSSSILSRGAHLRRRVVRKSDKEYKKVEEFLTSSLKIIMKENTFDFFEPKVAEITRRMESGYYAGHGLSSIKEDISRMCRDAMKRKNRGDARSMNHIITLFIRLATSLDNGSKSFHERDESMKTWRDDSPPGFYIASLKYKKTNKQTDGRYMMRGNNGVPDNGEYASDEEIKRHLSKLNKRSRETSDGSSERMETDDSTSSSESELNFESEGRGKESRWDDHFNADDSCEAFAENREWGARMTEASLVPPVTRKYEVLDHYVIVADQEEVERKIQVSLPDEYKEKLDVQKSGTEESDMEIPEVKDYKPRKQLGDEVLEQEVYGIDPYTHNLLLDSMPEELDWPLSDKLVFIEDVLLRTLNKQARNFTGTEQAPMKYSLEPVFRDILKTSEKDHDTRTVRLCQYILNSIKSRPDDNYVAYRKGLGVVCNKEGGFDKDDFVVEFLGEVYPSWKWFEKQDGIRSLQNHSKDPVPEFYNIYLERPKGDADGYDLVVIDAMHKANYASRICHSCRPNCEAKVTAVEGQYQIGIYTVRPIGYGEEVTFDYNSVTESKEEYEASVCLCGSQVCRGSYLNLTGEGVYQKVLKESHGILDRHQLMLEACEVNTVSEDDYIDLGKAGLGSCLLGGLPDWLIAYSARLVRFINSERVKLPEEILNHNMEEKNKYFAEFRLEEEKADAEVQAEGVYNQRLQNLALTLDKVRYVLRCVFGDPLKAPCPIERLSPVEAISQVWKGEGSLVDELLHCMAPYMDDRELDSLKSSIRAHDPSGSEDIQGALRKSLLWLRDEVRNLPCSYKCRHDAAADLIHLYAYTKCFFRIQEYKSVTSPPVYITPLDLGPKYTDKLGSDRYEYCKTYGKNYCLGQLLFWYNQNAEPDCSLAEASRGCLSLPDISSFYAKVNKPSRQRIYGPRTLKLMLARMERHMQRPWPKEQIWSFENSIKVIGSPMLDAVLHNAPLDKEMAHWLKHRPSIFHARLDR
ncbi:histone-lysine N-methyltransferase ATXR3-like [Heracleum sosnowskyi]|uniref:Histone-lysine N-methyltransferase ATXR3-like n=1 Tax=Heracleum sosnowskyi TaxID=360622 RepID=A0AAD8MX96_9APIA|nr:histone-lysine N-methyltransferase ATXR3-like [Heracleum sosnowskyi]